jgi:surface polysaccharide O-acyltransferase-like enzyme
VALIVLVVAHHAGQSFGPTGGAWPIYNVERAPILDSFFTVNAAFFMGLFFLISAYFLPASFERKGPVRFLKERFVRLGTPIAALLILGTAYGVVQVVSSGGSPWIMLQAVYASIMEDQHLIHFWFLDQLFVFSAVYFALRMLAARRSIAALPLPGTAAIVGYALALAAVTFLVRIDYPINRWVVLFGFMPAEVAHLPQYASMFALGILASRGQWLSKLPTRTGMVWLAIGVALAILRYVQPIGTDGGLTPGALTKSVWESFVCVGLSIGLLVLFREYVATPNRVLRMAAPNAYGVYLIHLFVVLPVQLAVLGLAVAPLLKFALVAAVAAPASFGLVALLRKLPGLREVL